MSILYEYRETTARTHPPILLHDIAFASDKGYNYRSVYGYPEETAIFIKDNGNTQNLKGKPVYSDCMFIDVDDEENVGRVREILIDNDIGYTMYYTGHRGVHIHILIKPMEGTDVIYSQIQWLKTLGLWELIDTSIYREGGQFRVIGAIHEKTGNIKYFLEDNPFKCGTLNEIPLLKAPPIVDKPVPITNNPEDSDVQSYFMNLMARRGEGRRHPHMFIIWKSGIRAGFDEETVKESIRRWNDMQDKPHDSDVLEKKLETFR